ncbi:MAG: PAS domain S-box protein [Caulobacteraceae bacterium]
MIWRADCSKKCNYFNERWLDFTGRTMEQEIGDGWTEGVHPEDIEMCFDTYSKAFDAREPFEMEYRLRNKNGQYRWILDIGRPLYDMDNNFSGYIGACFDITERKVAEEGLRKYQLLSRNANDIILFADVNGYVIEANDAAVRAFRYEKDDLMGKSIFYLVSPDPRSLVGAQPYQANTGGIYYEATAYRKDGSTFTAEVSMQGTEIGDDKVLMAILRDSTDRKRINEELKQAKESAEAANQAKSEFLANMSHEIRTPLNGIVGMIDLTLLTDLTEEQKENLYTAKECASTLLNLINDILDFSKIEAGKLKMEYIDFNIAELVKQAIKPHIIRAREKGLEFLYSVDDKIPQIVNGDPYRLKQVINNLVGNAVKFTDTGSINLSASLIAKDDDYVELEFTVSDTGIGIAPEDMKRLFITFSQVDSSHTRKYGGTGLGLAISKQLVEKMGGSIRVESAKGKGSSFYFTVKLGIGNITIDTSIDAPSIKKTSHPLQILLVEDDKVNQMVIARMIREAGHKIITANNGIEALQILNEKEIDIVLMDIQMPDMDGIEATRRIRAKETAAGKRIPIIAITAYALQGDKERFLSVGMDGYISKPIQMKTFLDEIEGAAERISGQKQGEEAFSAVKGNKISEFETDRFMLEYSRRIEPLFQEITGNINLLKNSFEKDDLSSIERYAHKIKKLSTEISATALRSAIFKVELAARKGDMTEAAKHFARVTEEFSKYKNQEKLRNKVMKGDKSNENINSGR